MLQGHAGEGALKTLGGLGRGVTVVLRIGMLCILHSAVILPQNVHTAQPLGHPIAKPILIALHRSDSLSVQIVIV